MISHQLSWGDGPDDQLKPSNQFLSASAHTLQVEESTPRRIRVRLEGSALLMTHAHPKQAKRGYDVHLLGYLEYDREDDSVRRFDLVALGDHWSEGRYTRRARPGKTSLGVAFELADGDQRLGRIPPQGARHLAEYFGNTSPSTAE